MADYIHLNPVRAGIVPVDSLETYRHSSYWFLKRKEQRPAFPRFDGVLANQGLVDATPGWTSYADYLRWQSHEGEFGRPLTRLRR